MKRWCLYASLFLVLAFGAKAQRSFSDSLEVFARQAVYGLRTLGTEPARKVAYDFQNAWTTKLTADQQEQIHQIALDMQRRGYSYQPAFWYYFSYLAYATAQADLSSAELSSVLRINREMLEIMPKSNYVNYLLGMSNYMARRILTRTRNILTYTDGGSYAFELMDEIPVEEERPEEVEQEPAPPANDPPPPDDNWSDQPADPWATGQNDPWAEQDDPWATDQSDPWADSPDPWSSDQGSYDDNWVDSDDSWGYDKSGQVYEEKAERQFFETVEQDYAAAARAQYIHPLVEGPVITLENNGLVMVTPYDSFKIKETDGHFLLKTREYAGKNAVINWPAQNRNFRGAVVNLGQFRIRPDRTDFWTPHAKLTFSQLFSGTVEGTFEFRSQRRKSGALGHYPVFTSMRSDISLKLPGGKLKYRGGVQLRGNALVGTSVSRTPGRLQILDGKGRSAVIRSERFIFHPDSTITAEQASIAFKHGRDSLHHPAVEIRYHPQKQRLVVLRKKNYNITPYYSTYFEMNLQADLIDWYMESDSINLSVMNGKDLVPMTVESKDLFNEVRFNKMAAGFNFHPVVTSVYYANKYGTREFSYLEIATEFKVPEKQVRGAMKILKKHGFAYFNEETGLVTLRDKAFLYHDASAAKVDYDNILIPSIAPDRPNASWRLDSGYMRVRGVDRFYLTSDFQVYAEPDKQELKLEKDRHIVLNGMVNAGSFQYKGRKFHFDYDQFLINMPTIDSIRIQLEVPDSLREPGGPEKQALKNHLNRTSGTLYLDYPDNKSGIRESPAYPDFSSDAEAVVYFDGPDVLNGAYDKSVKFIIPPFKSDSMANESAISFDGEFNSGGIFPTFKETLRLMPDQSLGFVHQIPPEGYNLYGTAAKTYEKIRLSREGIRGGGKIDFITSTIYSNDFIYYPDSVAAVGKRGVIGPGDANGASYPQAVLGPYRMHWLPRVDSMYLRNLREPFQFYNATATLDGEANITTMGVFGSGTMFTRGSRAISKELSFKEFSYGARHAKFEVLSDNPQKPALAGDDIRLNFDLRTNTARISPEKEGVAAISFPYAQMKTSITNAVWDLEDSVVTMTKPPEVPIENSYFYTTRPELDSLAFNAAQAHYDFNTRELNIRGIPYIIVADAKITPEGNETTILENSELQPFHNASIVIDTLNEYHYLFNGEIKILSRKSFIGTAHYRLITTDTFTIKFDRFTLQDVYLDNGRTKRMTVSGGEVLEKDKVVISPGFSYRGEVTMYAHQRALDLQGFVQPTFQDPGYQYWVRHQRKGENTQVVLDIGTAVFEDEDPVIAGLHYDLRSDLYSSFVEKRQTPSDQDFFLARGELVYDTSSFQYRIEDPAKTRGERYEGHTMIYNDQTGDVLFEGPVEFLSPYTEHVKIKASVLGSGNRQKKEFFLDAFMAIKFQQSASFMSIMSADLLDIIERLGPPPANAVSVDLLYKLANITGNKPARDYEAASLKGYRPLHAASDVLLSSLVISGVKMSWSARHRAWYNTTKLGISNSHKQDINAKLDGFLEISKDASNNDVLNLFIQAAPGTWYFISYASGTLLLYSSSSDFNTAVEENSNYGKAKPGELVVVMGDDSETLGFINEFREKYFGITEPYNLVHPGDIMLEDESFDTIEEEEQTDDGWGF